jgi:16S rRNA (adenine1518-N6/adenine1519-N6)-dimethyltransferase
VVSTVVRLTPHEQPLQIGDRRHFAAVVGAAFSQRRKTLRNSLKAFLDIEDIVAAGIDPGLRAEVLSPAQFVALSSRLAAKLL